MFKGVGASLRHTVHGALRPSVRALSSWGTSQRMFNCVDLHAEGEPARVVLGGLPNLKGVTAFDKMKELRDHHDGIRKLLLREPRGYPCQNADFVVPTSHPEASFGFIILEQAEYPVMSGHNCMCTATALLESGMIPMQEPFTEFALEAPAGLIKITATCENGKARQIKLTNIPCFCPILDAEVDVPHLGKVKVDVAYGGMWYAICDLQQLGLEVAPENGKELCRVGEMIKIAARDQIPVVHPENPEIAGITIIVLRSPASPGSGAHSRNAVIMSNTALDWDRPETWTGMIDRSPCGTGTSATMASLFARGELKVGDEFVHESILKTKFYGQVVEETTVGSHRAMVPTIGGQAWVTQYVQVVVDPTDPFPEGYTVGDIWAGGSEDLNYK